MTRDKADAANRPDGRTAAESEPGSLRLVATLAIAGLLSGVAIIGIFEVTLETITANRARELREAVFKVLPGVELMQKLIYKENKLIATNEQEQDELPIYGGYDSEGQFIGYAIPGEGPGFQDTIKILYGYKADTRKIVGMEVLDSRETPGLGDKIYKDASFVANFTNLSVEPEIIAVKKGKKSAPNEIDAITGATISSKAIVKIINNTNQIWLSNLPEPGQEPELLVVEEESAADTGRGE
ncbi:MAG: FMN-binding protein [Gammaproteobacteria bacterium]|nr:FMN-binding protein [Gammaproteobacteria bacterium]